MRKLRLGKINNSLVNCRSDSEALSYAASCQPVGVAHGVRVWVIHYESDSVYRCALTYGSSGVLCTNACVQASVRLQWETLEGVTPTLLGLPGSHPKQCW